MKDVRGQAKKEREYLAQNHVQQCVVCGRWFCRRKDNVCSSQQKATSAKTNASATTR